MPWVLDNCKLVDLNNIQNVHLQQMSRSSGFSLGGSYAPHRQLQQQTGSVSASDLQHLHASLSDSFPSAHLSASYHSQVRQQLHNKVRKVALW